MVKLLPTALTTKTGKIVAGALALILVVCVVFIVVNHYKGTFEIREAEREVERAAWDAEKHALEVERGRLRGQLDEMEAMNAALATVAESKRADRAATVKELEQIENEYIQKKAEVEASGSALSDVDLQHRLCLSLAKRGYKVSCTN